MSTTCASCNIRYAKDLNVCPWCGYANEAAAAVASSAVPQPASVQDTSSDSTAAPTHTETRTAPPPPPPPPTATRSGSVTYDLSAIPGPDEDWEPIDNERPDPDGQWDSEEWAAAAPEPIDQRLKRWAVIAVASVALIAVGAWLAEIVPVGLGSSVADPVAATPPPATAAPTTTPATTPATTAPPTTAAPPATAAPIDPVGTAIAVGQLRISETSLGPLQFGSDGVEVVGRLVATYGQPDSDSGARPAPAEEGGGFCEGEQQREIRWGSLYVFNRVNADGTEAFASLQVRSGSGADPDPAADVSSLSGLELGDTMGTFRAIYDGFRINEFTEAGGGTWEIVSGTDGRLLLYGTMSASDGEVTSIRSALRCGS